MQTHSLQPAITKKKKSTKETAVFCLKKGEGHLFAAFIHIALGLRLTKLT